MSAGVTLSLEKKRRMVDMLWPCCVNACAEWNLCQGNKTATKSLQCWKLSHSPCFGPDETCQMFVPPENDLSSVAFKAGWSICMLLFLKILVQSFTPCFLVFLYCCRPQATGKYFCHYACWCFSTFAPVPGIFLISCDFSSLKSSSLQFPSFLFYHPLLQSFPCEKGRDETASTPQKGCC